jgi:hypothetical protein
MKSVTSDRIYLWSKRFGAALLIVMAIVAAGNAQQFSAGEKGKVKGQMVSRKGDQAKVQDTKTGSLAVVVNIPMRRNVAPAGYGSTHPDFSNGGPHGRELNRRVDVKLVNNGVQEGGL